MSLWRSFFNDPFFNTDPFFNWSEFDRRMARMMNEPFAIPAIEQQTPTGTPAQQPQQQGSTEVASTGTAGTPAVAQDQQRQMISWAPRFDVTETKDAIIARGEFPGLTKDHVQIEVLEDRNGAKMLSIHGENKFEKREEKENYLRTERTFGRFERKFRLPHNVKTENIIARMENGLLELTIPKVPEEQTKKSKSIQIQ